MKKEISYKDMHRFALFCIKCEKAGLPLVRAKDWFKHIRTEG